MDGKGWDFYETVFVEGGIQMKKLCYVLFILLGIVGLLTGMGSVTQAQEKTLILATTTSTQDTGLLSWAWVTEPMPVSKPTIPNNMNNT